MHQPCSDEAPNSRALTTVSCRTRNTTSDNGVRDGETVKHAPREFLIPPVQPRSTRAAPTPKAAVSPSKLTSSRVRIALQDILSTVRPLSLPPLRREPARRDASGKDVKTRIRPSRLISGHSDDHVPTQATRNESGFSLDYSADTSSIAHSQAEAETSDSDSILKGPSEPEEERRMFEIDRARIIGWLCCVPLRNERIETDDTDIEMGPSRQKKTCPFSTRAYLAQFDSEMDGFGSTDMEAEHPQGQSHSNGTPVALSGSEVVACETEAAVAQVSNDTRGSDCIILEETNPGQADEIENPDLSTQMRSDDTLIEAEETNHCQPEYEGDVAMLDVDSDDQLYAYLVHGPDATLWDDAKRNMKVIDVFDSMKGVIGADRKALKAQNRFHPYPRASVKSKSGFTNPFVRHFIEYEAKWKRILDNPRQTLTFADVPWPIFSIARSPEDVTESRIDDFIQFSKFPGDKGTMPRPLGFLRMVARAELLKRWGLGTFAIYVLPRVVDPVEQQAVSIAATTVLIYLSRLDRHGTDPMGNA